MKWVLDQALIGGGVKRIVHLVDPGSIRVYACIITAGSLLAPAAVDAGPSESAALRWAHDSTALRPDPNVTWGAFDNGFRYALLPHDGVPGRVSMRLIVLAGSLDERPEEFGIAHFIEHMAFNGTQNFESGALRAFFQDLGMDMGSDINAATTFDSKIYMLEFLGLRP